MTNEEYKNLTVLVNSCDAYEDVWELFFSAYHEYALGLSAKIVLNTESKKYKNEVIDIEVVNFLCEKEDQWGKRVLNALNLIDSDYVLMVCEDFVLESKLEEKYIFDCIEFMQLNDDVAVIYLVKRDGSIIKKTSDDFDEQADIADYKVSSAPAVWRKEDLIRYIGEIDTPWAWEYFGSYRSYFDGRKFFQVSQSRDDIYVYQSKLGGAIYRGKWVQKVVEDKIEKYNLPIDIEERGIADLSKLPKRSFKWKFDFFLLGYRMIGFTGLLFFLKSIFKKKCKECFS